MSDVPPLFAFDPSDPEDRRRGTVFGSLAQGFAGGSDPVLDAASFRLARERWGLWDLVNVPREALAVSAPLSAIDRRIVGRAWYERARLALALLEHRVAGEDVAILAERLGALVRGAMWADPVAEAQAREAQDELLRALTAFRSVWERHSAPGEVVKPWPEVRRAGGWA